MSRAVLVANAPFRWTPELARIAAGAPALFAADGGANRLARIGLRPELVIGDLDSIRPEVRLWIGEERMLAISDQERTDLDKALTMLLDQRGLPELTVLGAVAGRLDHAISNLGLLAGRGKGPALDFVATDHRVVAVRGHARLEAAAGETWSFWTFDAAARVTLTGVRWPVTDAPLTPAGGPSISNIATADTVDVTAEGGAVLALRWIATPR